MLLLDPPGSGLAPHVHVRGLVLQLDPPGGCLGPHVHVHVHVHGLVLQLDPPRGGLGAHVAPLVLLLPANPDRAHKTALVELERDKLGPKKESAPC